MEKSEFLLERKTFLHTADFMLKVLEVYTQSMETIYLSIPSAHR